jgi:hypothetical protein
MAGLRLIYERPQIRQAIARRFEEHDSEIHFLQVLLVWYPLVHRSQRIELALFRHARILDHHLSGKDPEEGDAAFQKLLSARNSSILAHGVDPIGKRTAGKFLQHLDTLVTVPEELRSGARHAELSAM